MRSSLGREHEQLIRGSDRSQNQQGGDLDLSSLVLWVGFFWLSFKQEDVFLLGCKRRVQLGAM